MSSKGFKFIAKLNDATLKKPTNKDMDIIILFYIMYCITLNDSLISATAITQQITQYKAERKNKTRRQQATLWPYWSQINSMTLLNGDTGFCYIHK